MDIRKESVLAQLNMENEEEDYDAYMARLDAEVDAQKEDSEPLHLPKRGSPIADTYSKKYMTNLSRKGEAVRKNNAQKRYARKRMIVQAAFDQHELPLSMPLTEDDIEKLLLKITSKRRARIVATEEYIKRRVTELLRSVLPKDVRLCWEKYPQVMIPSPGFSYVASKEYGQGLEFWIQPNIPAFFEQGREVDMLRKEKKIFLYKIDKSILKYRENQEKLAEEIARYKWMLRMMTSKTYAGLLSLNPFWFEMLYVELTEKDLCNYD